MENNTMPPVQEQAPFMMPAPQPSGKKSKIVIISLIILVLLIGGGFAFAFVKKVGPFGASTTYTEENFFSNLLVKVAGISSSSYKASAALDIGARDEGATPFVTEVTNTPEIRQQYQD